MWVFGVPRPASSLCAFLPTLQLLEYEPRSGEQVPLLLKMKRSKLALSKAIESGDTDLGEQDLGDAKARAPGLNKGPGWSPHPTLLSCSVHSVAAPEERTEPRGFFHDPSEPAHGPEFVPTGVCGGQRWGWSLLSS